MVKLMSPPPLSHLGKLRVNRVYLILQISKVNCPRLVVGVSALLFLERGRGGQ